MPCNSRIETRIDLKAANFHVLVEAVKSLTPGRTPYVEESDKQIYFQLDGESVDIRDGVISVISDTTVPEEVMVNIRNTIQRAYSEVVIAHVAKSGGWTKQTDPDNKRKGKLKKGAR